jgi:hypothetical protein
MWYELKKIEEPNGAHQQTRGSTLATRGPAVILDHFFQIFQNMHACPLSMPP